jgi:hypothetical protein
VLSSVESSLPAIYTVPGFARVAVPAAGAAAFGKLGPIAFRFPSSREITGLLVLPELATPAAAGVLSLEIADQNDDEIFSDQAGDVTFPRDPFSAPALAMSGPAWHPFPLQRIVKTGDRWLLSLRNSSGVVVRVAAVGIYHREITL